MQQFVNMYVDYFWIFVGGVNGNLEGWGARSLEENNRETIWIHWQNIYSVENTMLILILYQTAWIATSYVVSESWGWDTVSINATQSHSVEHLVHG